MIVVVAAPSTAPAIGPNGPMMPETANPVIPPMTNPVEGPVRDGSHSFKCLRISRDAR